MSKYQKVKIDPTFLRIVSGDMRPRAARRLVTRSGRRSRGNFPSRKSAVPVAYESQLELAACRVLEVASSVRRFGTQPANLEITDPEHSFRYTPDLYFVWQWRETVVGEVKPDRKFLRPDVRDRLHQVTRRFAEEGTLFVVLLESDLKPDPDLQDDLARLLRDAPWPKLRPNLGSMHNEVAEPDEDPEPTSDAWQRARAVCDDLLRRVMDRSFAETVRAAETAVEQ
ncbi:hypothetical protein C1M51_09040 [Methylibium sp. Pch-M]|uniref:hypothetical protein n=1 Tax=Methylibium sp. Pch-M TaxID=2082386 RepID=UPI001013C0A3|nr:hypothetical protein [Methylibium sp. Pch-M]QAZ39568.1 hypothetical protein C1M51_09040 [Methylibium sp. Pch-M]